MDTSAIELAAAGKWDESSQRLHSSNGNISTSLPASLETAPSQVVRFDEQQQQQYNCERKLPHFTAAEERDRKEEKDKRVVVADSMRSHTLTYPDDSKQLEGQQKNKANKRKRETFMHGKAKEAKQDKCKTKKKNQKRKIKPSEHEDEQRKDNEMVICLKVGGTNRALVLSLMVNTLLLMYCLFSLAP